MRREQGRGAASWRSMGSGFHMAFAHVSWWLGREPERLQCDSTLPQLQQHVLRSPRHTSAFAFAHQPPASRQSSMHCHRQPTWKPGCRYESRMRLCSRSRTCIDMQYDRSMHQCDQQLTGRPMGAVAALVQQVAHLNGRREAGGACQQLQAAGSEGEGFPSGCKGVPGPPPMLTAQPKAQGTAGQISAP